MAAAILIGIVWIGVLSGFGTASFNHIQRYGLDYPLIVHLHAVVFFGWLVLFTTQMLLIRRARPDLHKKLGSIGAALALVMLILGPATAIVVASRDYAADGEAPVFLAVQFTTILAFAGLAAAGLSLRTTPAAHKRLMLMGLAVLGAPGFARFLNAIAAAHFRLSFAPAAVHIYFCSDVLIVAMGAYDLINRRRLHPAYLAGVAWSLGLQGIALTLLQSPEWKAFSLHFVEG